MYQSYDNYQKSEKETIVPTEIQYAFIKKVGFSQTNFESVNPTINSMYKIIPLHHNLKSLDGLIKPSECIVNEGVTKLFDYDFTFNGFLKKKKVEQKKV